MPLVYLVIHVTFQEKYFRHYNKTLNLEIRPMLARVLADNFSSISSIEWGRVLHHREFSGHTDKTLRTVFYSMILPNAARRLGIGKFELTLEQIAGDAEANYKGSTVSKRVERRQREVLEYFENAVKLLKIPFLFNQHRKKLSEIPKETCNI